MNAHRSVNWTQNVVAYSCKQAVRRWTCYVLWWFFRSSVQYVCIYQALCKGTWRHWWSILPRKNIRYVNQIDDASVCNFRFICCHLSERVIFQLESVFTDESEAVQIRKSVAIIMIIFIDGGGKEKTHAFPNFVWTRSHLIFLRYLSFYDNNNNNFDWFLFSGYVYKLGIYFSWRIPAIINRYKSKFS